MLLPIKHHALSIISFNLALACAFFLVYHFVRLNSLNQNLAEISTRQVLIDDSLEDLLFSDHLKASESIKINSEKEALQTQVTELLAVADNEEYLQIKEVQTLFANFNQSIAQNDKVGLDTTAANAKINSWGEMLIARNYETLRTELETTITELDAEYQDYLASLPPPPTSAEGYSYQTVTNERGTFGVYLIKMPLSSVRVVTAAANGDDCSDDCPTKSLAQHVQDNGGFAGINGTYFCPPDYGECGDKTNSFDYALYRSSGGNWLNDNALSWGDTGLATFNGSSPRFYKRSSDYDGDSVSAGISNYPSLLEDGDISIDEGLLSGYQKDVRGLRGAIGAGGENLYLAIISNATVIDSAYVMRSLGAQDALNLDGGGSSAMYINGGYVIGPGRSLPNAVVLVR